jgi:hypothetical protein
LVTLGQSARHFVAFWKSADGLERMPAVNGAQILHIDATTTQITRGHPTCTWRQETFQQTSPPYLARTIDKRLPGTPPGTEGTWGIGGEAIYDPTTNTIYDAATPKSAPGAQILTPAQQPWMLEPHMAQYIPSLKAKLASGTARVDGRAAVDGRVALRIKFAGSDEIDYVAADGSMVPIKTIQSTGPSGDGQLINVYYTFEYLTAEGNAGLLSLTAQHPSARIDRNLRHFRAAIRRLHPNG